MSDLGDFSLPSYPTFPTTSLSEVPFLTEHDQTCPPSLIPSPTSNMASSGESLSTSDGYSDVRPATGNGDSSFYHTPTARFHNESLSRPSSYTQSSNSFSTVGAATDSSVQTSPGVGISNVSFDSGSSGVSSVGSNVRGEPLQASRPQPDAFGSQLLSMPLLTSPQSPANMTEAGLGVDGMSGASMGGASVVGASLVLRVQALELLCGKLKKERADMEEMFGRQRKAFMNQMSHTDAQLSVCKSRIDSYEKQVRGLKGEVEEKEKALTESAIRAANIREQFDADRVKYEEEIASLKAIVTVQSQDTNQAVQQERDRWIAERKRLMAELEEVRKGVVTPGQGVVTPGQGDIYQPNSMASSPPDRYNKSPSPVSEDENLELSMIKAKEDAKVLRSVVLPLEQEIKSLKKKLHASEGKVEELETTVKELREAEESSNFLQPPLIDLDTSLSLSDSTPSRDFNSPIPTDAKELQHQLRLARSACSDLEMHTSQMNMQKHIMQDEIRSLMGQLKEVKSCYLTEKDKVEELKKTWELANDHFIVAQDKLKQEIYRLQQKLERGDAASPLRDLSIEDLPAPNLDKIADKDKTASRRHQRSLSSEEATEAILDTNAVQHYSSKSASWSSLYPPSTCMESSAQILDLEEELKKAQAEVKRQTGICGNLEQQFARVQSQMASDINEKEDFIDKLKAENTKLQASVMRQKQQHETLRRLMDDLRDEMRTKIETFQNNEKEFKAHMKTLREKFIELKQDSQREIAKMSEGRREVYQQLQTSKEEYECLKKVQREDMIKYQAEIAFLKQSLQEITATWESTQQQLLITKEQLQHVREMMLAERANKEKLIERLEEAEKRITALSPLEGMLEAEKKSKADAMAAKNSVEKKARDFVNEQNNTIEQITKAKSAAESQVQDLLRQVASLKHKLNHTEETQKDFVKLSQSLQMQLASIEEEKLRNQELQESLSST